MAVAPDRLLAGRLHGLATYCAAGWTHYRRRSIRVAAWAYQELSEHAGTGCPFAVGPDRQAACTRSHVLNLGDR